MNINIGSGNRYKLGWVNVDLYADQADIRKDIREVHFDENSADTVLASHVLEHFDRETAVELTKRFARWLKPCGKLIVEMPNWARCRKLAKADDMKSKLGGLKGLLGGRQTDKELWNQWMLDHEEIILRHSLTRRSFEEILPPEWNLPGWNHIYVWEAEEYRDAAEACGLESTVHRATIHGPRHGRDFRVEGVKP